MKAHYILGSKLEPEKAIDIEKDDIIVFLWWDESDKLLKTQSWQAKQDNPRSVIGHCKCISKVTHMYIKSKIEVSAKPIYG